jgi:2-amino-4-hydroxy-6-hydroxymethyldihydropteridine diphosphokinase
MFNARPPASKPAIVYLSLGSNLGDRAANLWKAITALHPEILVDAYSPVYETEPWGFADQPRFFNQALRATTLLPPLSLLRHLKHLETTLGRAPTFRYGPRPIDLDILFYDDLILDTPELILPHPRLHERAFVLVPLADLAPDLRHPRLGKTIHELLASVDTGGIQAYQCLAAMGG